MPRLTALNSYAWLLAGALSLTGHAAQQRSVADGVYSQDQAARGRKLYQAQCVECHGAAMEGTVRPPLLRDAFLANFSARPLSMLVDRIQKTMPFNEPGSLTREQSTDLAAYMLEVGTFRAGTGELTDAALAQIAFPVAR